MPELKKRIEAAMKSPRPEEAQDRIKTAVAEELRALDPALEQIYIRDDFNHSYHPDFILEWGSGRGKRSRPVYLRLLAGGDSARLDAISLSDQEPLFLGLLNHRLKADQANELERHDFDEDARSHGSFLTSAAAVDALAGDRGETIPPVVTSALVRRGSGLLRASEAVELGNAVATGYEAAVEGGDPGTVDRAAEAVRRYLSPDDVESLDLQLDLVWLAGGGKLDDLDDGDRLLHANLKPDQWSLLLDQFLTRKEGSGDQLWSLFGAQLSLDDAAKAVSKITGEPTHLDAFIRANERRWKARYAGVVEAPPGGASKWAVLDRTFVKTHGSLGVAYTGSKRNFNRTGIPMRSRTYEGVREVMQKDRLLSLSARDGGTSIQLLAEDALPGKRVDQVVEWTDAVTGLQVQSVIDREQVKLWIDYEGGQIRASKEISLASLVRRATAYFDAPVAND